MGVIIDPCLRLYLDLTDPDVKMAPARHELPYKANIALNISLGYIEYHTFKIPNRFFYIHVIIPLLYNTTGNDVTSPFMTRYISSELGYSSIFVK